MDDTDFTRTTELVRQAQGGDASATEELFRRYYARIRPLAHARLGPVVRRDFDSLDIVQDAFAVALRKLGSFELRDEESFLRWMRRIVERQILDKARRVSAERRHRGREVRLGAPDETGAIELESPRTGPFDASVRNDRRQRIAARLEGLPEQYRQVVTMRIEEGLSWEEVARRAGSSSADAARMIFSRALRELARSVRLDDVP